MPREHYCVQGWLQPPLHSLAVMWKRCAAIAAGNLVIEFSDWLHADTRGEHWPSFFV